MQIHFLNPEYLFQKIYEFVTGIALLPFLIVGAQWLLAFSERISRTSFFVSLLFCIGIGYAILRIRQIRKKEGDAFAGLAEIAPVVVEGEETRPKNAKWEKVLEHMLSPNAGDWRLAILEADIMLDELLDALHYRGDSMGDKLKKIEKSDFTTLDLAWEAHKIRNKVAHEGSEFLLSEREAKRVISLYEEIFREFRYI